MRARARRAAAALAALALAGAPAATGEDLPGTPGRLVEGIGCRSDPTQTYSLYLPSGYPGDRRWPALLIFDPRGRSVLAAELFVAAAEEFGWILLSSDNTRSDGPWEPNQRAIDALWPEVHTRYATDPDRLYATGFSGGAILAWQVGQATGRLAGVIGVAGRLPDGETPDAVRFAHFGAVGSTDFNYRPMRAIEELLARLGTPHRREVFAGPHRWFPAAMARQALGWMEVVAIRQGRRPPDPSLVGRLLAEELAAARVLEEEGEALAALERYQVITATYRGLAGVAPAEARIAALGEGREVRRQRRQRRAAEDLEVRWWERALPTLVLLGQGRPPLTAAAAVRDLRIDALEGLAADPGPSGFAAQRVLERIFTQTSFYLARDLRARDLPGAAAVALEVATEIHGDGPVVWYNLACARAQAGDVGAALRALERAVAAGFGDRETLTGDSDLAPLREEERYRRLVAGLDGGSG